ncbi:hypothetical protein ACFYWP_28905 [Actinacidiphila glaucinigra]|uniref:hypothetical protein n=1 Tax=Actinacidiphila glaucinigra TaxID=235986 RepID=UPI003692558B
MGDELSYEYREAEKMCFAGEVKTPFATGKNMDEMKAMLANANPDTVESVAHAWGRVHDMLVKGDGSVKAVFDKAVDHILQHWEGAAAEGFATKAKKISKQIDNTATYAHYTSTAMQSAANVLRPVKAEVDSMEKPSTLASMGDKLTDGFDRNEDWQREIRDNRGAQSALDNHEGSLSAGKEAQLKMAARMETLALTYTAQSKSMGQWNNRIDDPEDYPPTPVGQPPVPVVVPTTPSRSVERPKPSSRNSVTGTTGGTAKPSSNVKSPRDTGITGGLPKPAASTKPQVGTAIDGIVAPPGAATGTGGGTAGAGGGGVGTGGTVGGGAGGAAGGLPGGVAGAGLGARGGAGARGGSAGAGARAGAAGRGGMPGAGGAGAGAGGRGGAAAGRGGGLARRGGGVVGAAKGTGSGTRGTPGGSGLHKSRGAAGAGSGGNAGRGANRMMGRGQSDRTEEEERREGERPDYLVEDEETWTPERNNAPRVIE